MPEGKVESVSESISKEINISRDCALICVML